MVISHRLDVLRRLLCGTGRSSYTGTNRSTLHTVRLWIFVHEPRNNFQEHLICEVQEIFGFFFSFKLGLFEK